jgi:hypothetical protein
MYRITYTYMGFDPGVKHGEQREIQFTTSFAFTAYERWLANPNMQNLKLQQWHKDVGWRTIKSDD